MTDAYFQLLWHEVTETISSLRTGCQSVTGLPPQLVSAPIYTLRW